MKILVQASPQNVEIDDDPARLDVAMIHDYLSNESYWAQGRSMQAVVKSIQNSMCFGIYLDGAQVGFARVVTDRTTFAWLCDVFVIRSQRGKGLGKLLVKAVIEHPELQGLRRFMLATRDAHTLYRDYAGFEPLPNPERWMARTRM